MSTAAQFHQPNRPQPRALPGFGHINRYWDRRHGVYAAKILPGEYYVSQNGEMIVTVLGSCVSACIRDRVLGIGGMNHFMLPIKHNDREYDELTGEPARYGNWAMELLINEILKLGGKRSQLEVKIFGGGRVVDSLSSADIGQHNIHFVEHYLQNECLSIAARDTGDFYPRKVLFFPDTGSVKLRKIHKAENNTIAKREASYADSIEVKPATGDIDLF